MARTIGISPVTQYEFRTNDSYRREWSWLPSSHLRDIIAAQLTYLDFHGWLKQNLKHSSEVLAVPPSWQDLAFDVDEGFHRTDLLLYASVCEAAIHAILSHYYNKDKMNAHQALKSCYEKEEQTFHHISTSIFGRTEAGITQSGKLCLRTTSVSPIGDSEIKFAALIRSGEKLGIYGEDLRDRLNILREDRNTIHLGQHVRVKRADGSFNRADRDSARDVTEELRCALESYTVKNP
jgi:hypothetical protein